MPFFKSSFELLLARVDVLSRAVESAVFAHSLLVCFVRFHALLDEVGHLSEGNKFVADNLVVLVESQSFYITISHFEVTNALSLCTVHSTNLGTSALTEVFKTCADVKTAFGESRL